MTEVMRAAIADARVLQQAGFPALIVENYGDVPFHRDQVPPETVAAMALTMGAIAEETGLPLGVNVLRNDGLSALGVASAVGAVLIRVNVLTGVMYTDQGPIVGNAAELLRKRAYLCPDVEVWADVMVKHATPPPRSDIAQMAVDTVERGQADAVIVSGSGTGAQPDLEAAREISEAVSKETRVVIGSGANPANLAQLLGVAGTVIVGSYVKFDGDARNRVDPSRAERFVEMARQNDLVL